MKPADLVSGAQKPIKVYGLLMMHKEQRPLIDKHCFGDCGKVSLAGVIDGGDVGGLWVCPEDACPWLGKQTDAPYGTTTSFGKLHDIHLRLLTETPAAKEAGDAH